MMALIPEFESVLLNVTGAKSANKIESIQSLWSGYGEIARMKLEGASQSSIIIKNIALPTRTNHPQGWNTNRGHQRKLKSYEVEMAWYKNYADKCNESCRVPKCYATKSKDSQHMIVLEDLDAAGFPLRHSSLSTNQIYACLSWLANFHAVFLGTKPDSLWGIGTYWHLETRPDELEKMDHPKLKEAAPMIDQILNECQFKTLVHGDAKVANFCFSTSDTAVAAVDFQYVGGGCGMKDVVYFIGSILDEKECESRESELLHVYFAVLKSATLKHHPNLNVENLENEWRKLFPIAWTDFHRFLLGWSPGHWKINTYSEKLARKVITKLGI
eukprot:TCONS_00057876-protein